MKIESRLRKFYAIGIAIGCVLFVCLYWIFSPTIVTKQGVIYYLKPGTSPAMLVDELSVQGVVVHPYLFSLLIFPQKKQLKSGEYLFPKGASIFSITKQMTSGTGLYYRSFTLVPGWSFKQLRAELAKRYTLRHNTQALNDNAIMALLTNTPLPPEGQFFPETYNYTRDVPDLVILKRAYDLMQLKLTEAWNTKAENLPYKNSYEALIAASLIEKEAYLVVERPIIASVLINRLQKKMLLQFDPTVIYGLGDRYDGAIHKKDLQEDTPYNTYLHSGLPPTPIAMPSIGSINAAMHPQESDFLYFVAKEDGSHGHQFSKTLPEHQAAVVAASRIKRTQQ